MNDAARIAGEYRYGDTGYAEADVRAAIESYIAIGWPESEAVEYIESYARLGLDLPLAERSDA